MTPVQGLYLFDEFFRKEVWASYDDESKHLKLKQK